MYIIISRFTINKTDVFTSYAKNEVKECFYGEIFQYNNNFIYFEINKCCNIQAASCKRNKYFQGCLHIYFNTGYFSISLCTIFTFVQ